MIWSPTSWPRWTRSSEIVVLTSHRRARGPAGRVTDCEYAGEDQSRRRVRRSQHRARHLGGQRRQHSGRARPGRVRGRAGRHHPRGSAGCSPAGDPSALAITGARLPEITAAPAPRSCCPATRPRPVSSCSTRPTAPGALGDVDVVFPVLHGAYGEDGTIQGLLEMAGIPYVGAGVFASAAAMDKEFTKKLAAAEGIPVGPYAVLRAGADPVRGRPRPARPAGLRQAGPGRLLVRHHQGQRLGRPGRGDRRGARGRPEGAGRGGHRRPRDRVRRARGRGRRRAGGLAAGRDPGRRATTSSTTSRRSTSTTSCEFDIPADLPERVTAPGPGVRRAGPSPRSTAPGWPGSTSSSPRSWTSTSTRSTRCRASPRRRCSRGCGPRPAWSTRSWSPA